MVSETIRKKLGALPHKPGVYLMKDRFGTVIYVGKARDLRKRVSQYFQPSRRMHWDLKFRALIEAIADLDTHLVRSEPEALLLEGRLIKEFHPRYNISFRDDKRFLLVKVNLNDPIPRFTFTRLKQDDGARYFGPFPDAGALRNTLTLVRHRFNLRGCRPLTPTERDYRHCLYAHLKYCTAPCIGNVTREQYLEQVKAACDFLAGQCAEMQDQLELGMRKAAERREYERAAELRDMLADLRRTTRKTEKFERIPYSLPLAINPDRDLAELAGVLRLPGLPQRIEGIDISNISGTFAVASLVSFKNGRPDRANYRRFKIKSVAGQDDFASVAEVVRRRYRRLLQEGAAGRLPGSNGRQAEGGAPRADSGKEDFPGFRGEQERSSPRLPPAGREGEELAVRRGVDDAGRRGAGLGRGGRVRAEGKPAVKLPDLILIDGGRGQLNAACKELDLLGLSGIPIIGLAKEFEEIYQRGEKDPLRLPAESGALKLLQRVRDESHRFANTYNAQLRLKRISESILDEFPNIGERRKAALLKKFGSVQRIRMAGVEAIAAVPGFGGKAAAELKAFLDARLVSKEP